MDLNDLFQIFGYIYDPGYLETVLRQAEKGYNDQRSAYYNITRHRTPIHSYEVAGIHYEVFAAGQL